MWINLLALAFIGLSIGIVVAGGVFSFIAIIGIVPRLVQKTNTNDYIRFYEDAITLGGLFGTLCLVTDISLPIGFIGAGVFGFFSGIFIGSLAVSLAEVLDVIPILIRRLNLHVGMAYFMVALALGKTIGSLIYFLIKDFTMYSP